MSSFVFPSLPGLDWPLIRTCSFLTLTAESMSKRVAALSLRAYAVYTYSLTLSSLQDSISPSQVRALVGLFSACRGRFDSFLYSDPAFNTVASEPIGSGDGSTKDFQIVARFHNAGGSAAADIIQNFNGAPIVLDNGASSPYVLGPTGIVSFTTAPSAGHPITWSGSFYQRCHFLNDSLEVQQIMNKWYAATSPVQFKSVLL